MINQEATYFVIEIDNGDLLPSYVGFNYYNGGSIEKVQHAESWDDAKIAMHMENMWHKQYDPNNKRKTRVVEVKNSIYEIGEIKQ